MLYQKIAGPYKRNMETNKVMPGIWTSEALEALADVPLWHITEKIDGTNIRVIWDGYRVSFGGRTDKAQLPGPLVKNLEETFPEEKFEQTFGETSVVLFGEGYGGKIQKGGKYRQDQSFALFDVAVNDKYLRPFNTEELAESWGIEHAPVLNSVPWTLHDAIYYVEEQNFSRYGQFEPEGVVAKTYPALLDHRGNRVITKIKGVDFA